MKIMDKLEEWLGGTLLLVVFLILIAQILARQLFHTPFIWSEELAKLLFVYVGLLGISMAIRSQQQKTGKFFRSTTHFYFDYILYLLRLHSLGICYIPNGSTESNFQC